jgi:hypothetical protein
MADTNPIIKAVAAVCWVFLLGACSSPPKPTTPALTPGTAAALLQVNSKAKNWLEHVKKDNASCDYKIELPDQSNHPSVIDLNHLVTCGGRPSPRALDASVSFAYDKDAGHWVITRFLS